MLKAYGRGEDDFGILFIATIVIVVPFLIFGLVFFVGVMLPDIVKSRSRLKSPGLDEES